MERRGGNVKGCWTCACGVSEVECGRKCSAGRVGTRRKGLGCVSSLRTIT